jgi:hypothetical protein
LTDTKQKARKTMRKACEFILAAGDERDQLAAQYS